jgi:hypothetical protein
VTTSCGESAVSATTALVSQLSPRPSTYEGGEGILANG